MRKRAVERELSKRIEPLVDEFEREILPSTLVDDIGPAPSGERALIAAILLDGLRNARGWLSYTAGTCGDQLEDRRRRFRAEAQAWIESDVVEPMSFVWCCQALDIDPDRLRAGSDRIPRALDSRRHGKGIGRIGVAA